MVLITVALISFLANFFINEKFNDYITRKQALDTKEIVERVSQQYEHSTRTWNHDFIYTIGMFALYDGYIIKVYNIQNKLIWDAQEHDMSLCAEIMNDISQRMNKKFPQTQGKFTSEFYNLSNGDEIYGSVSISYFGPFFLSENDFKFLDTLNIIFFGVGVFSLVFSILVGIVIAKRLSNPILKTVEATKHISEGNYKIRIETETNTKEIALLTVSINHLAFALENQENQKKQLTEDVAHELRTPIAVLQSHLEAMVDGVWKVTPERLQGCHDEVVRIGKLVSELERLERSDNDNLKLDKTETNLLEVTEKALSTFETEIRNKSLTVKVHGLCSNISVDKDRINQVIVNLLSNAVKYTNNGNTIDIIFSETKDAVVFSIQDNGIGILEKELPYIFDRFYRADKSRNRMTGGSGIGLAIVKSIVEAHGGKVSVKSEIDHGSCFEIKLPKDN